MFGIGSTELIVIVLVLLIFVGPRHLPGMARKLGQIIGELRMASRELRNQIDLEMTDIESPSKMIRDAGRELIDSVPSPYEEVRRVERKLKQELAEAAYSDDQPGPDPGEGSAETTDSGQETGSEDTSGSDGAKSPDREDRSPTEESTGEKKGGQ